MLATIKKTSSGPKPAPGERYPSGKKKPDGSIAPTTFYRLREHGVRLGADPRLTTVIGRMGLFKELTDAEVDAAFRVAEIYGRYEHLKGIPKRHAASPSYQSGFGNKDVDINRLTDDEIKRHKRAVRRAEKAYDKLQGMLAHDLMRDLVERACCDDVEPGPIHRPKLVAILRRLAVDMGLVAPVKATKPKADVTPADHNLLVTAAVDALADWFATNLASKPTAFSIIQNDSWKSSRGITATDGKRNYTLTVPLRGMSFAAIDAQIRLACAVKGWTELRDAETGEV